MGAQLLLQQGSQGDHVVTTRQLSGLVPTIKSVTVRDRDRTGTQLPQVGAVVKPQRKRGIPLLVRLTFLRKEEESYFWSTMAGRATGVGGERGVGGIRRNLCSSWTLPTPFSSPKVPLTQHSGQQPDGNITSTRAFYSFHFFPQLFSYLSLTALYIGVVAVPIL